VCLQKVCVIEQINFDKNGALRSHKKPVKLTPSVLPWDFIPEYHYPLVVIITIPKIPKSNLRDLFSRYPCGKMGILYDIR
jgi:hypothetical protein